MKYVELKKSLKNLKSEYILYGADQYLIEYSIFLIKSHCIKDFPNINFYKYDCTDSSFKIEESLATLPFGNDKRVVVYENAVINKQLINIVSKYLAPNNIIIFVRPEIKDECFYETVDCNPLDLKTLSKFIKNFISKYDIVIDDDALNIICEVCDYKLEYIVPELEKLCIYSIDIKKIDKLTVEKLVFKNENYFTYNLTAAYENNDHKKIISILNSLSKTMNYSSIYSSLGGYFRKLFYTAVSNEKDEVIAKYLNIKPYAIKKAREVVKTLGAKKVLDKYQQFVVNDDAIKNGKLTPQSAILNLLIN